MTRPRVLIFHSPGTNRDAETLRALELAGAEAEIVHVWDVRAGTVSLADCRAVVLPGGFGYGDALGAGVLQALDLTTWLQDAVGTFVGQGGRVLGICNGFQTLVKSGLLDGGCEPAKPGHRAVTLTHNERGHFECRWVHMAPAADCAANWLRGLSMPIFCPVAHGEGRFLTRGSDTLNHLAAQGRIALRYVQADGGVAAGSYPHNPNGSVGDVAGICSPDGLVVGFMPHPEDHLLSRHSPVPVPVDAMGLRLFEAFVEAL